MYIDGRDRAKPYYLRLHHDTPAHDFAITDESHSTATISARIDGERRVIADVDTGGDPHMAHVITGLLRQYRSALNFHTATGSRSHSSVPGIPLDEAGDEYAQYGNWLAAADHAQDTAEQWTAYAERLAALTAPDLPKLPRFDPKYPTFDGHSEQQPPFAATDEHLRAERRAAQVRAAVANAYAYRAYADQVRAHVKLTWPHLDVDGAVDDVRAGVVTDDTDTDA